MNNNNGISAPSIYGPVKSRRLGRSIGIKNIPPKTCNYNCMYCSAGVTRRYQTVRSFFYTPDQIYDAVTDYLEKNNIQPDSFDYFSFTPDGEPTLDINLGKTIDRLIPLGQKLAVISNASGLLLEGTGADLAKAHWVSLKIDAVDPTVWKKLARPGPGMDLEKILKEIQHFAAHYNGILVTETMLLDGVNDDLKHIENIARFLSANGVGMSYLAVPAVNSVSASCKPAKENVMYLAYEIFSGYGLHPQFLIAYEDEVEAQASQHASHILNVTRNSPVREDAMIQLLSRTGGNIELIDELISGKQVIKLVHGGKTFYMRKHPQEQKQQS